MASWWTLSALLWQMEEGRRERCFSFRPCEDPERGWVAGHPPPPHPQSPSLCPQSGKAFEWLFQSWLLVASQEAHVCERVHTHPGFSDLFRDRLPSELAVSSGLRLSVCLVAPLCSVRLYFWVNMYRSTYSQTGPRAVLERASKEKDKWEKEKYGMTSLICGV